jgi:hypothetical protein
MARHSAIPFQFDRPVFVKIPIQARGRVWEVDSVFKWKEMQMDAHRIITMYNQGFLYHDEELEASVDNTKIGDGLDDLDIESLHVMVKKYNAVVKEKAKTQKEYEHRKCKFSSIKARQIGIIRNWRHTFSKEYGV